MSDKDLYRRAAIKRYIAECRYRCFTDAALKIEKSREVTIRGRVGLAVSN